MSGRVRPRTARRAAERAADRRLEKRERARAAEEGGSAANPTYVTSGSQVEARATSLPCPNCGGHCRVLDHTAEAIAGRSLRVLRVECARCAWRGETFVAVVQPS
ncbi:MAG: hypothetical protein IT376_03415 [Polyangiaceae bacterium]|nr:hypothetical protein [Polyangiaceae bacterium]